MDNVERWQGIVRPYSAQDVIRLGGSVHIEHSLARRGAEQLWRALKKKPPVVALGAVSGHQAVQYVLSGCPAIYCSGWQVAADANVDRETYPDQSLYSAISVPLLVERINNALHLADKRYKALGKEGIDWLVPIVADGEAGFGGVLNVFELMRHMIKAGAAAVHFEDQLSSEKKCGHLGGKVIVPTREFVKKLVAARLAADIMGVATVLVARTDALSAKILANDVDYCDRKFIVGERSPEGYFYIPGGLEMAIGRALAYAPYADMIWCETSKPDLEEARIFAEAVHRHYPGKPLAYNCSPSFNWKKNLDEQTIAEFKEKLNSFGYKFQFITLAGFHSLNYSAFELARAFVEKGMTSYVDLQEAELLAKEQAGYTAVDHQKFVGTDYFDQIVEIVTEKTSSTLGMKGSTEEAQF